MTKKNIYKFTSGFELPYESADLTSIIESLYQEVAIKRKMDYSFNDMKKEIDNLIGQMSDEDIKTLVIESLFLNTITYENQMMEMVLKKYGN
jgi:hypothetical protein